MSIIDSYENELYGFGVADENSYAGGNIEYSASIDMGVESNIDTGIEGENTIERAETTSKLVYESRVSIDTLEFTKSCEEFKSMIREYKGFIETQKITDDGDYRVYIYDTDETIHHRLNATIRIPSEHYSEFMSEISGLGDVRSSEETVQNMTQKYGTLQAQLEIYETEYDSYMAMLSNAKDDATKLEIRKSLTEIAVCIATIKSQMSTIDTDVAYSIVHVIINEVEKYQEEKDESTFKNRLLNTIETSKEEALEFIEYTLFAIILNWYKVLFVIVFATVIMFLFAKFIKLIRLK
jgi:hypothetical protein